MSQWPEDTQSLIQSWSHWEFVTGPNEFLVTRMLMMGEKIRVTSIKLWVDGPFLVGKGNCWLFSGARVTYHMLTCCPGLAACKNVLLHFIRSCKWNSTLWNYWLFVTALISSSHLLLPCAIQLLSKFAGFNPGESQICIGKQVIDDQVPLDSCPKNLSIILTTIWNRLIWQ